MRRQVSTDSPCMQRIICTLRDRGPMIATLIPRTAYISPHTVREYITTLLNSKLIHIIQWIRNPTPKYILAYGPGNNAPKPTPLTSQQRVSLYRTTLLNKFGKQTAIRIMRSRQDGGVSTIQLEGEKIYQRRYTRLQEPTNGGA